MVQKPPPNRFPHVPSPKFRLSPEKTHVRNLKSIVTWRVSLIGSDHDGNIPLQRVGLSDSDVARTQDTVLDKGDRSQWHHASCDIRTTSRVSVVHHQALTTPWSTERTDPCESESFEEKLDLSYAMIPRKLSHLGHCKSYLRHIPKGTVVSELFLNNSMPIISKE